MKRISRGSVMYMSTMVFYLFTTNGGRKFGFWEILAQRNAQYLRQEINSEQTSSSLRGHYECDIRNAKQESCIYLGYYQRLCVQGIYHLAEQHAVLSPQTCPLAPTEPKTNSQPLVRPSSPPLC